MLTPDYLDALPHDAVELYRQVEDDILRDIARRIGKMDEITATADWQAYRLQETAAVRAEVVKTLSKYSGKSEAVIRQMMRDGCTEALTADDAEYLAMGLSPSALNQNSALLNLLNAGHLQTLGTWRNLTATTANTVAQQFEGALDRAWLQVSSGAFDYNTAIKSTVDNLAASMQYVTYPTGKRDTLEVAVRRAVLTGVNQTACKLQDARADEMGCGYVEVSAHSGARSDGSRGPADHAYWQGKVYHRGGAIDFDSTHYEDFVTATGYGRGEGLCGWNCRHNFHPFWPGVSVPAYTPERLVELNAKNIEYNGKQYSQYEINQMQRALERRVRSAKRKYLAEDAAGRDSAVASVQLKDARQKLKSFIQLTSGKQDGARESVNKFGHSAASSASWKARRSILTNAAGQPIIKMSKTYITGPKNGITQKNNAKGGIDRNYYDADGRKFKQISNNGHGHKKEERLGLHGEHAHNYFWDENGKPHHLDARELTEEERKENGDIL